MHAFADDGERERPQGAMETAIWCNGCMLPSACRWPIDAFEEEIRRHFFNATYIDICEDCGNALDAEGWPI